MYMFFWNTYVKVIHCIPKEVNKNPSNFRILLKNLITLNQRNIIFVRTLLREEWFNRFPKLFAISDTLRI